RKNARGPKRLIPNVIGILMPADVAVGRRILDPESRGDRKQIRAEQVLPSRDQMRYMQHIIKPGEQEVRALIQLAAFRWIRSLELFNTLPQCRHFVFTVHFNWPSPAFGTKLINLSIGKDFAHVQGSAGGIRERQVTTGA